MEKNAGAQKRLDIKQFHNFVGYVFANYGIVKRPEKVAQKPCSFMGWNEQTRAERETRTFIAEPEKRQAPIDASLRRTALGSVSYAPRARESRNSHLLRPMSHLRVYRTSARLYRATKSQTLRPYKLYAATLEYTA